jgi:hypothetical protein
MTVANVCSYRKTKLEGPDHGVSGPHNCRCFTSMVTVEFGRLRIRLSAEASQEPDKPQDKENDCGNPQDMNSETHTGKDEGEDE